MILIGVKSKYGSCSRNCTGLINVNKYTKYKNKKNSLLINLTTVYLLLTNLIMIYSLYSSTVERNTVNILIYVQFILRALTGTIWWRIALIYI
jgi:hypothetical protein